MMNIHSKYDNNEMIYALKFTNNHVISGISCMLSQGSLEASIIILPRYGHRD